MACLGLNATACAQSAQFVVNAPNDYEFGELVTIPAGFGAGEFTLELWVRPNAGLPDSVFEQDDPEQLTDWFAGDPVPYSSEDWWYGGNFLLDGHNNNVFEDGTFSLQFYGAGRVRWLFGDGTDAGPGFLRAIQADPADSVPSLLDGNWHRITLVRIFTGVSTASLELWVDGVLIDSQESPVRTDMRNYWDSWSGFPVGQEGWFFGSEKQAAVGIVSQYEDYKGLIDEISFFDRALTEDEIETGIADTVGLVGFFSFFEGNGAFACDDLDGSPCIEFVNFSTNPWSLADVSGDSGGGGGGGCFIATAAYGTPLHDDLNILRAFRDAHLLTHFAGAGFVDGYYRLSPALAAILARHESAASPVRAVLSAVVALVSLDVARQTMLAAGSVMLAIASIVLRCRMRAKHSTLVARLR